LANFFFVVAKDADPEANDVVVVVVASKAVVAELLRFLADVFESNVVIAIMGLLLADVEKFDIAW
jgi:hypothetical protein